jgi:hypothetical protein
MTEVNGYRSTDLTQQWLEQSHSVAEGEGKKLDWKADHQSMDAGLKEEHEAPAEAAHTAAKWVGALIGIGGGAEALKTAGKAAFKSTPELLDAPHIALRERAVDTFKQGAKWMGGVVTAEFAAPAAGVAAVGGAVAEVVHAANKGDELKHLSDLDAMDVAVTSTLTLDAGFQQADIAKHPGIFPEKAIAFMQQSEFGKLHKPELQAAADEGSRAAFDAIRCGGKDAYLKANPECAKRLAGDIAFNKGFESVIWSAWQRDGQSRLDAIKTGLDDRDARSTLPSQSVRG